MIYVVEFKQFRTKINYGFIHFENCSCRKEIHNHHKAVISVVSGVGYSFVYYLVIFVMENIYE